MSQMRRLEGLEVTVQESQEIPDTTKEKLQRQIENLKSHVLRTDKWVYRIVVIGLVLAIIASLAFTFSITLKNTDPEVSVAMPEIFMAIGSAAVGALAGLLAPRPGESEDKN